MEEQIIPQNRIRQLLFLGLLILLGALLVLELYGFLPALLGAITLYMMLRKAMFYLALVRNWNKSLAAALLMFLSFVVILIPIGTLVSMMTTKVTYVIDHSNELIAALKTVLGDVEEKVGFVIISTENINKLGNVIVQIIPRILNASFGFVGTIFFMYFILYFMLVNGRRMEVDIYEYIPLQDDNVDRLGREVQNTVFSNAVGIPVIGFLQGLVAVIGYLIIGVKEPWFWFVVTCITAMLPVVGAALAYVPLAIIFFANNQIWQGVFMLIYGFGLIGTVDNIFRFTLARKIGNVHPLVTVFGVIIGLKLFGFIGLIFGPLLISLFMLLVKIYSSEFIVRQRKLAPKPHRSMKN